MTTTRPYRKALGIEEAIDRLEDAAGSQLDPDARRRRSSTGIETASDAADARRRDRPTPLLWTPARRRRLTEGGSPDP